MYTLEFDIIFQKAGDAKTITITSTSQLNILFLENKDTVNYKFIGNYSCRESLIYTYSQIVNFVLSYHVQHKGFSYTISVVKDKRDMVKTKSLKYFLDCLYSYISQVKSLYMDNKISMTFYDAISPHLISSILLILDDHYDLIDHPKDTMRKDIVNAILRSKNSRWSGITAEKILTAFYIGTLEQNYSERYYSYYQSISTGPGDYSLRCLVYQLDKFSDFIKEYSEPIMNILDIDDDHDDDYDDDSSIDAGFRFLIEQSLNGSISKAYKDTRGYW